MTARESSRFERMLSRGKKVRDSCLRIVRDQKEHEGLVKLKVLVPPECHPLEYQWSIHLSQKNGLISDAQDRIFSLILP